MNLTDDQSEESNTPTQLVPLFIPSLAAILKAKEDAKGLPLTEEEVQSIRDDATVIMVSAEHYYKMEESRGYRDIDPENCWQEWKELRKQF